jgi:hypothetical protein
MVRPGNQSPSLPRLTPYRLRLTDVENAERPEGTLVWL